MHKSNVKTEETVQIKHGDYVCLLSAFELDTLSNGALRQLGDTYENRVHRYIDLGEDYTLSQGKKAPVSSAYVTALESCRFEINHILKSRRAQFGVRFFDLDCDLWIDKYSNGTTSLRLFSDGPVATATVCLPEVLLPEGYVLIKDYDENTGVLAALVVSGIVKDTGQTYPVGRFNHANFCRLTL